MNRKPTLTERMQAARIARAEAAAARAETKLIKEREKAELRRIKNKKTEARIKVREREGGAGMKITFFDKAPPLSWRRR